MFSGGRKQLDATLRELLAESKMAVLEGASPFNPTVNIFTSAWLLFEHTAGGWQHWECK